MAKFCTKCGKELKDGVCANCEGNAERTVVSAAPKKFDIKEALNDYLALVKGMFTKSADTMKSFAKEENVILGILAIVVNCIISGVLLYCLCDNALGMLGSVMGMGSMLLGSVELPFFKVFMYGFIFMLVGFFVTALMIYVVSNFIFKDEINIKKAIALVGACSAFTAVTTLASIILVYLSVKVALFVILLAGIFYLTYLYQGTADATRVNRNMLAYVFVPTIAVTVIVVVYFLPKILF